MRQRLGLAAALLGDPELLILDEPANGLDPEGVRWLRDFLRAFAAGERTVLVSSHVLAEVAQTVDQVLIINRGKLVVESSLEQLTARVGGSVRVRTPERGEAAARRCSASGSRRTDGRRAALLVHGTTQRTGRRHRVRRRRAGPRAGRRGLLARGDLPRADLGAAAVIAQTQRRAAEDPLDPHDDRARARDDRADPSLLAALRPADQGAESDEHRGPARPAQRRQPRRGLLRARRDHARDQRVPLRHDPPDLPVHAETITRARRQARRRACSPASSSGSSAKGSASRSATPVLAGRGIDFALDGGQTALLLLGTLAGVALWGAIGVGIGAIVRNQVGAIIGLLAWGFVVENLLFAFVPSVGRFAPVHAQDALIGLTTEHLLPAAQAAPFSLAWTAAFALAGTALAARRDVS